MSCKVVVRRFTQGLDSIGDVVNVYPSETYLGNLVEPVGGAFIILDITDCDYDDVRINQFLQIHDNPTTNNKIYGLDHIALGNDHYNSLISKGRVSITIADLLSYKKERNGQIQNLGGNEQWLTE